MYETDGARRAVFADEQIGIDRDFETFGVDGQAEIDERRARYFDAPQLPAFGQRVRRDEREKFRRDFFFDSGDLVARLIRFGH